jgi:predicted transcriptional regulator
MGDVIVKVGGSIEEDGAAFVAAWKRAEAGENFAERQVGFESWDLLTRTLTGKRMELLQHLHRHPAPSVLALAKSLGRQYRRVHEDVEALAAAGLVDKGEGGLSATYDVLRTVIVL